MSHPWPHSMTVERYAAFEAATGMKVAKVGDIWWHQVRPFLYRPLLPYKKYDLQATTTKLNRPGAFQFGVTDGQPHNSYLNPIVFDDLRNYDIKNLRYSVRKHINKARKNNVTISALNSEREFSEQAYPCYMSFYQRTKYEFDKKRQHKEGFAEWSHTLFQFPEMAIHGAFVDQELVSFEISCRVENTLILKTLVNSERALKVGAADLLLHNYRLICRDQPEIQMIYDSMLGKMSGINDYYRIRGARVLAVPACLQLHPALLWLIKKSNLSTYRRLVGLAPGQIPNDSSDH